jgi:glycosyltransferase 2 family protein
MSDESSRQFTVNRGPLAKRLLRVTVSGVILLGLAWRMDWSQVAAAFRTLRWSDWAAALAVHVLAQCLSALRWRELAQPLGFDAPFRRYLGLYFVGMFFNLLLPTSVGGDAVRAIQLNAGSGRRLAALLSVLLDRLSGLLVLLALACAAALACPVPLPLWVQLAVGGVAGGAAVSLALLPWCSRLLARLDIAGAGRWHRLLAQVRHLAGSLRAASIVYRNNPRLVVNSTALSVLVQAAGVVTVALLGRAVGADVPLAVYGVAVPMVALLTLLPVSLNGMGVREAGMVLFLQPAGVEPGRAATIAFLWFLSQTVAGLMGAGVYLSARARRPEVMHDDAVGDHSDQGRARERRAAA